MEGNLNKTVGQMHAHKSTGTLRQHAYGLQGSAPDGVLELEGEGYVQMSLTVFNPNAISNG